jgi:signal transduction histidine kinase
MLLINVVMVKFAERDLIQAKMNTGRVLLQALGERVGYELTNKHKKWAGFRSDLVFKKEITQLLEAGGFEEALMINAEGIKAFSIETWGEAEKKAVSISRLALTTRKSSFDFYGSTWGVIWLAHKRVNMSAPILYKGRVLGAISISAELSPLYQTLRKSEKIILIYILLNTILFVLFGIYLLSRTVIKPIHKLLRITEEFKEGEPFPHLVGSSQNEIGQLFRSLNMMLKRLEENKRELKANISSLEEANRELKKAQDEIIKSEKLASVGRLATGVAHEIGNPIGIILGYLELLGKNDLNKEEAQDFLDRIELEIRRISQIIRQLLDFSRPSSSEPKHTSVHALIMETVKMLTPQPMMAHIQIQPHLKAEKDTVWTDPNQLKQVFLNIIMNAADAMADNEASDDGPATNTLTINTINMENSIELRFTDTGPGIGQEELAHIFDPFYTTKEPGKGTGLGLSICYRIIEGLGGSIKAESSPGKGTTITIDIPVHRMKNGGK